MSDRNPLLHGGMLERIFQLEDQVKGLMETVNQMHKAYQLQALNIPKPDQYVRTGGYTMADVSERMPHNIPVNASVEMTPEAHAGQKTSSVPTEEKRISTSHLSTLAPYTYSPLNSRSSEIRILALKASLSPTEPITCRLVTADLDKELTTDGRLNSPPIKLFTPLSYCWGTTLMTEAIVLDSHLFLVTPSLHRALLHFRNANENPSGERVTEENKETFWWIDAICINQNDLDERSSQVGLMTRLYKVAQTVHVWLGEESEDSSRAMNVIRELAYIPSDWDSWKYIPKPGQTHRPDGPGRPMVKLPTDPPAITAEDKSKNYSALISLYQRPWFTRVWIRQEVALPDDVKFHCGAETCSWEEIMRVADMLTYLADEYHLPDLQHVRIRSNGSYKSCFHKAIELDQLRAIIGRGNGTYAELQELVFDSRDCQATDPLDKIYAMLPLTNPDEIDVTVDYRKDSREVYKELAIRFFNRSLDYLVGCQNPSRSNGLPSWVPNLAVPWRPLSAGTTFLHDKALEYHWGNPPDDPPHFSYQSEQSRLDIQGVIFDEIRAINHESWVDAELSNADLRRIAAQWRAFFKSQREQLFECWEKISMQNLWEKEKQCERLYDSLMNDVEWESLVLQNTFGDEYRGGNDATRFKPMADRVLDLDPTFKRIKRLLLSDSTSYAESVGKDEYFATLRPLAVNRRLMFTSKGTAGLVPAEAKLDDKVCFFDSCKCPFIIRDVGDNTWILVGQAYFFSRITLYGANPRMTKTIIRLV
ncbi:hypothetical protein OIDMADRAFT_178636 [Oidiodendron maius Zn]|uniref:Heterokaryon incompatibility domain-containing protein n=1 Tax=Oidiodendron maius (strain Zn) TaxID=913774 RepID=A0A0C3HI46_OIDMZ|nr:hypothetical protein OIDMADRAFT_178636 [Oidiodendron maius Zn]